MNKLNYKAIILALFIIVSIAIYSFQTGWNPLPPLDKYWFWRSEIGNDDFNISFTKISAKENIPESILKNINQLEYENNLERGLWYFNPEFFEVDKFYFMICGGSDYSDKYDVNIIDHKFEYSNPNIRRSDKELVFRNLSCEILIEELAANHYDYNKGVKRPFVIFMINERDAETIQLEITTKSGAFLIPKNNFPISTK